jgi:hypothetical protein
LLLTFCGIELQRRSADIGNSDPLSIVRRQSRLHVFGQDSPESGGVR